MIIEDGRGTGEKSRVDRLGRLSVTTDEVTFQHSKAGLLFNFVTGRFTLTTASVSAAAYLRNNEEADLVVFSAFYLLGPSSGGSGQAVVDLYRNPTGISTSTAGNVSNLNFGSNRSIDVDFVQGAEGASLTGGAVAIDSHFVPPGINPLTDLGGIRLPSGSSLGVTIQPPSGNTNLVVDVAFLGYLDNLENVAA